MTFQDFGSLGELVAGIATLITLIYLAIQIKQNSGVIQTSNYADLSYKIGTFANTLAQDSDLHDIYLNGIKDYDSLVESEQSRFDMVFAGLLQTYQAMYHLKTRGYIDEELLQTNLDSLSKLLQLPGVQKMWEKCQFWWEEDFRHLVYGLIDEGDRLAPIENLT